jgi:hypothetical protein
VGHPGLPDLNHGVNIPIKYTHNRERLERFVRHLMRIFDLVLSSMMYKCEGMQSSYPQRKSLSMLDRHYRRRRG